jgi:hypothetical protein
VPTECSPTRKGPVCLVSRKREHVLIVFPSLVSSAETKFLSLATLGKSVWLRNLVEVLVHDSLVMVNSLLAKEVLQSAQNCDSLLLKITNRSNLVFMCPPRWPRRILRLGAVFAQLVHNFHRIHTLVCDRIIPSDLVLSTKTVSMI